MSSRDTSLGTLLLDSRGRLSALVERSVLTLEFSSRRSGITSEVNQIGVDCGTDVGVVFGTRS